MLLDVNVSHWEVTKERALMVDCEQRKLLARSERVKAVDFHPTEPCQYSLRGHHKAVTELTRGV